LTTRSRQPWRLGGSRNRQVADRRRHLHNNHISGHPVLREVDIMFQNEIHYGISATWDGGIEWYLGTSLETCDERGNENTLEEALAAMANMARKVYPESTYARYFMGDVSVDPDQRGTDEVASLLADKVGSFALSFSSEENYVHPEDAPWILTFGPDRAIAGGTADELLRHALDSQDVVQ